MLRILLDCEKMKYANTGLFEFCKQLGNALLRNMLQAEELAFYIPPSLKGFFGAQQRYLPHTPLHRWLRPACRSTDIWHTTFQTSHYRPASRRTKRVLTIHDLNYIHEQQPPEKIRRHLQKIQRNIDSSDHIVTISHFVMEDVKKHLRLGNRPASVVMNGCDLEAYPGFDSPVYRPAKPFLFTIGSVNAKKNFHVLPCLLVENDYELVIAGPVFDEAYRQQVLAEAQRHGVAHRVKILGPVPYPDKYWYLSRCAAFLFPSLAEGFGLPVVEAMTLGKACFISNRTSLPEIGGPHCYYFHTFEPAYMQQVFSTGMNDYCNRKPEAAIREHAAAFTYDRTAQGYLNIYRNM